MDNTPYSLNGKTALITGGSRGIGLGIARLYVALGATVIITGRDERTLQAVSSELGEACYFRVSDIDDCKSHEALVDELERSVGAIDILVNNAGRHCKKPSVDTSEEEFRQVLETNLVSLFSLTRHCLLRMMPRGGGSIINISSMSAIYGLPQVAAYSSSKTGLLGLTRTLASECSGSGVRINAIAPGFIESKMFLDIMDKDPDRKARILARTPMNRFGQTEDIAHAAGFLASDGASFITGTCLPVDGGNAIGF